MSEELKERPILFSGAMVRAILEGRKTQTRRVVKAGFDCHKCNFVKMAYHPQKNVQMQAYFDFDDMFSGTRFPYGKVGDRLWVREAFCKCQMDKFNHVWNFCYLADTDSQCRFSSSKKWTPSICHAWPRVSRLKSQMFALSACRI